MAAESGESQNELLKKFITMLSSKGFFNGTTVGSPGISAETIASRSQSLPSALPYPTAMSVECVRVWHTALCCRIVRSVLQNSLQCVTEYQERYAKAVEQFQKKLGAPSTAVSSGVAAITAEQAWTPCGTDAPSRTAQYCVLQYCALQHHAGRRRPPAKECEGLTDFA